MPAIGLQVSRKAHGMIRLPTWYLMSTNRTVSKWESGVSSPGVDLIPSIASALGISLDQLFGIETQNTESRLFDAIKEAVSAAVEEVLPDAVEGALEELLPEYITASLSQDGYTLSVLGKNRTTVHQFRGEGKVLGPTNINGNAGKWVISLYTLKGYEFVGTYDSQEEAAADLNRIFKAYTSGWSRIEL